MSQEIYRALFTTHDERLQQDMYVSDLKEFMKRNLKPGIDYRYRFDPGSGTHSIQLKGIYKYFIPSRIDYTHPLFSEVLDSDEPIDAKRIEMLVNSFFHTVYYVHEEEQMKRYNMLLANAARANDYSSRWSRLVKDEPRLLNYVRPEDSFQAIIDTSQVSEIDIPLPPKTFLSMKANDVSIVICDRRKYNAANMISDVRDGLSAMHTTFHLNTPHYFRYRSETAMLHHVATSIIMDWKQEQELRSGEVKLIARPVERLVIIVGTPEVYALHACGNMYFMYNRQISNNIKDPVTYIFNLSKQIMAANAELKRFYDTIVKDHITLYLTAELYQSQMEAMTSDTYPYMRPLPESFTQDYESTTLEEYNQDIVTWLLNPVGSTPLDEGYTESVGADISANHVRYDLTSRQSTSLNYLLKVATEIPQFVNKPTDQDFAAMEDQAITRYVLTTSPLIHHVNNVIRAKSVVNNTISDVVNKILASGRELGFRIGAGEELFLFAGTNNKYTRMGDRIIPANDLVHKPISNNSTAKLLMVYMYLLNRVMFGTNEEQFVNTMRSGAKLVALGSITDEYLRILREFHNLKGVKAKFEGYGMQAMGDNVRVKFPLIATTRITGDIVISDIQQSTAGTYAEMLETVLMVTEQCVRIADRGAIKINQPSLHVVNSAISIIREHFNNDVRVRLIRLGTQNIMTSECFLVYDRGFNDDIGSYFGLSDSASIFNYLNSYREDVHPVRLEVTSRATLEDMDLENSATIGIRCLVDDIIRNVSIISQISPRAITARVNKRFDEYIILARSSKARMLLTLRGDRTTDQSLLVNAIPNGFGTFSRSGPLIFPQYVSMQWPTLHKLSIYTSVATFLEANRMYNDVDRVISIGGRDLTDIYLAAPNLPFIIIDPAAVEDDLSSLNIEIYRRVHDFREYQPFSLYTILFVIMTDESGAPRSAEDQYEIIRRMARAAVSEECVFVFNFYSRDLAAAFLSISRPEQVTVEQRDESLFISFGGYLPTEALDVDDVAEIVRSEGATMNIVNSTLHDVCLAMNSESVFTHANQFIELQSALAHMPTYVLSG